jgi:hypothetical protein
MHAYQQVCPHHSELIDMHVVTPVLVQVYQKYMRREVEVPGKDLCRWQPLYPAPSPLPSQQLHCTCLSPCATDTAMIAPGTGQWPGTLQRSTTHLQQEPASHT